MDGPQVQMLDQNKDKDKDKQPSVSGPQSNLGTNTQPATPVGQSTPGTGAAQPQQVKPASKGTGFVGVRRLLGASAGSRLGQQVGGRVQQAGEQARAGIAGARQEFQQKAGRAGEQMQQQAGAAKEAVSGILGATGATVAPSAEQQAAFQQIATGQYTGPRELTGTEQLASKAYEAQQLGKLAGTAGGRQELLQQQFGQRGGYGSRLSALDALILGKTGGRQLAQAKAGTTGLEKELATGEMAAAEQAKALQAQASGLGREVLGEIGRGATGLKAAAEKRFGELKTGQEEDIKAAVEGLQKGEVSEELASKLGLKEGQFLGQFSEQELKDIISKGELPTLATSVSKEDFAKMEALKKLGGGIAQSQLAASLSPFKTEEAGKYDPMKSIRFAETAAGESAFDVAQRGKKSEYERQLGEAQTAQTQLKGAKQHIEGQLDRILQGLRSESAAGVQSGRTHDLDWKKIGMQDVMAMDPYRAGLVDREGRITFGPQAGMQVQGQAATIRDLLSKLGGEIEAETAQRISPYQSKLARTLKIKKAEPK